ncbi:hypothetical protein B0H14DRAFT_2927268, partial [Mycena olivaceomarginata]
MFRNGHFYLAFISTISLPPVEPANHIVCDQDAEMYSPDKISVPLGSSTNQMKTVDLIIPPHSVLRLLLCASITSTRILLSTNPPTSIPHI